MKLFSFGKRAADQASPVNDALGQNRVFYLEGLGLVTQWYITTRCLEECYRSERYDRPLALLLMEPESESDSTVVRRQVGAWVREELRVTDIPARLNGGRYAVLLVETNLDEATIIAGRLRAAVRSVRIGLSHFPDDGMTFDELIAAATDTLDDETEQAA